MGADPGIVDKNGVTPLHLAAKTYCETTDYNSTELIDIILETGQCNINAVDNDGWTPLHYAFEGSDSAIIVPHLIEKGADPTIANKEGNTSLHLAASHEKTIETISLILENEQVDINSRNKNGMTALHHAIRISNVSVRYLLKKGADPNAADENGATPLHLAAKEDYWETTDYKTTELIDIILETGKCDINGVDNYGRTPLHYAIDRYAPVTINVRRLIEMGADPGIADKNGVTPLHLAARNAVSMDLIEVLLNTKAVDVNCVDIKGRTPLACARDHYKHGLRQSIIDRLKEYGAKK
jgi:ankyrin repeat protein